MAIQATSRISICHYSPTITQILAPSPSRTAGPGQGGAPSPFTTAYTGTSETPMRGPIVSRMSALIVGVATLLLLPGVVIAQFTSPRLLFAQATDEGCNIRYWYEGALEAVNLARMPECPEELFVDATRRKVFVADNGRIRTLTIYPAAEADPVPLPDTNHKVWLGQMEIRPEENTNYHLGVGPLRPSGIRYLDDGALGVVMSLSMAADDEYHYLFKLGEDGWSIVATKWCERWGCQDSEDISEPFHSQNYLSTRGGQTWPAERMIWHPALFKQAYVVSRNEEKHEVSPGHYDGSIVTLGLKIDGVSSTLATHTGASAHSDSYHTFTIDLVIDGEPPINLSKNQCLTSIVGRYILVYEFFRGRFEVTDLQTGETLFSDLSTAAWID